MSVALALLTWGTFVGLDLVTVPQVMIARPIVAGPLAGFILGDVWTGLQIGVLFELFQYDVLPVGAARYPEYGPATVAAVSAAHLAAGPLGIGLGAVVGLVTALAGGMSIHVVRRLNARAMHRAGDQLEAGDTRALVRLHLAGIARDAARAALVTGLGLALARLARDVVAVPLTMRGATWLSVAAVGAALAAAAAGTLRVVGRGLTVRWFAVGLMGGAALAWLR